MNQSHLHSENFDLCRICLCEPESNRDITFVSIFMSVLSPSQNLCVFDLMSDLLGMKFDFTDVRPKIICEGCYNSLLSWFEFKTKSAESEIVINYIASKQFVSTRPETSIASTPSLMLTNNDQSSQESSLKPRLKRSRLQSNQSNMFGASTSRTLCPSTSSMMLENHKVSTQPSTSSQTLFDHADESTQASTSSLILKNNTRSTFPSQASFNHIGKSTLASTSSQILNNKTGSTFSSTFNHFQEEPQTSNAIRIKGYGCSSDVSSRSIIANRSNEEVEESDDDCIEIITPIETVDLTSIDESENVDEDSSDYEESVALSYHDESIELSDSGNNMNFNNENKTEKLYYCSICQKKKILNHDCSQHTKSFFTCLVPNCNILSRSKRHFTSHYLQHIGMSSSAVLCHHCFQEIEQSNIDCHLQCNIVKAFKCFTCNVVFNSMQEFAFHKLKTHNGLLMNGRGNYLCLRCEKSSPELSVINDHMKYCLENQINNVTAANTRLRKSTRNETKLLPFQKSNIQDVTVRQNGKNSLTSEHVLFTCLKPNCNLIFQTFRIFKLHYRSHFKLGNNSLICWQCCKPFSNTSGLRNHQVKKNCRTPGMFKCFVCPNKFDDLESLSIHKFTYHNGNLMACKRNNKTIKCAFCQMDINIFNFKSHLATCNKKDVNKNTRTKKDKRTYNCLTCEKVFFSSVSLSNHSRIHNRARFANVKNE